MSMRGKLYTASISAVMVAFAQPVSAPGGPAKNATVATALVYLDGGDPERAKAICDAALNSTPTNTAASNCLTQALAQLAVRDIAQQTRALDNADALLRLDKKAEAVAAVAGIQGMYRTPEIKKRAEDLLKQASTRSSWFAAKQFMTDNGIVWISDVVIGALIIATAYWLLKFVRLAKRLQKTSRASVLGIKKQWRVTPVEDATTFGISSYVLSAYQRLAPQLQESYNPIVLFLPTRNKDQQSCVLTIENNADIQTLRQAAIDASQEPSRWRSVGRFLRGRPTIKPEGFINLKQQQFEFTDALKELAVKVGAIDVSSIAKFFTAIGKWFDVGIPTLAGSVVTYEDSVVIALTQADITTYSTVVAASKDKHFESIIDAANNAVYKMLYVLGHENSHPDDVEAAATVHSSIPALRKHLTGETKPDEELLTICQTLGEARRSLSDSAPPYLYDRVRLWEAAARFQSGQREDLQRAVRLVSELANSEGRAQCYHDTYNLAVLNERLGELDEAHKYYLKLASIHETWSPLVTYGKVALLTNPVYQQGWSRFESDVQRWRDELYQGLQSASPKVTDRVGQQINALRPPQIDVWRAILAATLDCPKSFRPTTGSISNADILSAARHFLDAAVTQNATAEVYLMLARTALYTHDFATARQYGQTARGLANNDPVLVAMSLYVQAEGTYSDASIDDPSRRAVLAIEILQNVADDAYILIPALRAAARGVPTKLGVGQ